MTRTQWLLMEPPGGQDSAAFRTRLAGAGCHLPPTHLSTSELMSS
ncbi:MAG TPA: 3-oxoacyl-ACP synthase, partial [Mycobacterium sp.]